MTLIGIGSSHLPMRSEIVGYVHAHHKSLLCVLLRPEPKSHLCKTPGFEGYLKLEGNLNGSAANSVVGSECLKMLYELMNYTCEMDECQWPFKRAPDPAVFYAWFLSTENIFDRFF